jgi:DNA-binding IclR family transcriptional regulator
VRIKCPYKKFESRSKLLPVKNDAEARPYSSAVAVERAADLLFLIAEHGEASLTDLARAIGSSGSAVHRILTALKNKGLIQQTTENGPYSLSWSILALTRQLTSQADLRTIALPYMRSLRDLAEETVTLNVRSGFDRVCIDQAEGPHEVSWRHGVGKISPLYAGATGKVLLAYLSPAELKEFWRTVKVQKVTPFTTVKRDEILAELQVIREQGYATGTQDRVLGVAAMAAPIYDSAGSASATLTIAGPADRCSEEKLEEWVAPLTTATTAISELVRDASLAGAPPPPEPISDLSLASGAGDRR